RITMAVAGFREADLNIEVKGNTLTISGKKTAEKTANPAQFLHQGIASRAFECRFQLAGFVEVRGAEFENGLLHVALKREIPEAMKPRTIVIQSQPGGPKTLENKKVASSPLCGNEPPALALPASRRGSATRLTPSLDDSGPALARLRPCPA